MRTQAEINTQMAKADFMSMLVEEEAQPKLDPEAVFAAEEIAVLRRRGHWPPPQVFLRLAVMFKTRLGEVRAESRV